MGHNYPRPEFADKYIKENDHNASDYFGLIREILRLPDGDRTQKQNFLNYAYDLLFAEIIENTSQPTQPVSFGTSGWRGKLGKDINARSVVAVTLAILRLYESVDNDPELQELLGVKTLADAQKLGCVLGFDNRFAGSYLAAHVAATLIDKGFMIHYAGESTTGVLSAAVMELGAAFSINLTPSHNPLDYGGFKFNAADAGPAPGEITSRITAEAQRIVSTEYEQLTVHEDPEAHVRGNAQITAFDSLVSWEQRVLKNKAVHGLNLDDTISKFEAENKLVVVIDCVHGASRLHIRRLFNNTQNVRLVILRDNEDVTFGGVAPEPSSANMSNVTQILQQRSELYKIGAIIDPDGDRIRFTDGTTEISMNQFGAMAYHFLHEYKGKKGLVAKTVATSNLANAIAEQLGEDVFEPPVGFKYFKEVFGKAVVCFEESDGISIIGHTPEKDAYIGLLLALDLVLSSQLNLGEYLRKIESEFGAYYPDRDGVEVSVKGKELDEMLARLEKYKPGKAVKIAGKDKQIASLITVDGRKIIFEDGSWLMIRPSGTEPKVRFYVEARTPEGADDLVKAAKNLLKEAGVL